MTSRIAHICPDCRRIVPAGARCACKPRVEVPQAMRLARQPWRAVYAHPTYRRNRQVRYAMADGKCERCGADLARWECDHVIEARRFVDAAGVVDFEGANAIENLRVYCPKCHKRKGEGSCTTNR